MGTRQFYLVCFFCVGVCEYTVQTKWGLLLKFAVGSDFKDDSLNLMPFFSASCYSGYSDDAQVRYAIPIPRSTFLEQRMGMVRS